MKVTLILALLCVVSADEADKNRPVSKVINVLKDMVTQLEKEAEEDEETYEAFACWCSTNDKEKTKSIADGEQAVSDLTAAIEGFTAGSAKLVAEIGNLDSEIAKNTEALESATAMRRKELAEFNAEEKSTLQTIQSLKNAVIALSKHHEASFLQESSRAAAFMKSAQDVVTFHDMMRKSKDIIQQLFTPSQRKVLQAFVQDSQDGGYAPASGEIFGMLKQMKETFETNLANSQKEETANQRDYENLKATKEEEITAGNDQLDKKTEQLAVSDEKNAQSKESLVDTQNVLAADIKFLANLKEQCGQMDAEYEERSSTRAMEIQAVSKALSFLNSDEAHDLFTRSFNFAQVSLKLNSRKRDQISKLLAHAAQKAKDPELSLLAVKARQDAFKEVKANIQKMVDKLVKEKEDEIKKKDYCQVEILQNEHDTQAKTVEKNDLQAKIEDLKSSIHELATEIEALKAEVAELQVQIKRAGENREKANKEFQITIADQRATQKLLGAALGVLKEFYDKMALVQTGTKEAQAPPPKFKSYEKNAKSGGVMGMMKSIIDDSAAVEAEAIRGEEDEQKAYEDFVKDSNLSIDQKTKKIVNKSEMKAKDEKDKVEAENELESVLGELEALDNENADLHKECDFTLKNFDLRQTARGDEIEALKQAIAMFSGASFSAFLEMNDPGPDPASSDPNQNDDNFDMPLLSSFTH